MDDRELGDLLRRAVPQQLPAARFDHAKVLAAAERARTRRGAMLLGGVVAALVLVAGGGVVAVVNRGVSGGGDTVAASAGASRPGEPRTGEPSAGEPSAGAQSVPGGAQVRPFDALPEDPQPSGVLPSALQPPPPSVGVCGPVDRSVYAALVQVFPELSAQQPFPLAQDCPAGTTGAGVLLTDRGVVGRLEVLVGPAEVPSVDRTGVARSADGRTVTVVSVPAAGATAGPYAAGLNEVAAQVAAALR